MRLVITFIALVVLALASWLASAAGTGSALALAIAGIKALLIGLVFMELSHAHTVPRVIALTSLLFVALLCAGIAVDVALR